MLASQNRLASASSAYLKSASHQPIDWYEFGDDAFARAKELDRLILLDIGAAWCHWCHVIDRESYENQEIADLINASYVAVKVDRDQRPDIDTRYQQVVASISGQGGWPLTVFLTSDGRVLFGGTYFPPETMKKLLTQMHAVYQEQKTEIMTRTLETIDPEPYGSPSTLKPLAMPLSLTTVDKIVEAARRLFDASQGGFGIQPKFPHFSTLALLIQQAVRNNNTQAREMVDKTLTAMAQGGVYDQIVGGFHRYSVDQMWHVPHFEKMAYDNAEALTVYAQAYCLDKNPLYLAVVDGILRFTSEILSDQEKGGFYASQDADIDLHDDGDHFTWTPEEIKAILPPEEAELIAIYYDIQAEGDMHDRPGRNVLWIRADDMDLARRFHASPEEIQTRLASAKQRMLAHRQTRPTPFVDTTLYLNWNGMFMGAYFEVADILDRPDARAFAQKTMDRLRQTHVDNQKDELRHTAGISGMLEDYAWMIHALLKAYQSTTLPAYLEEACHWTQRALTLFYDTDQGGFYDIAPVTHQTPALLKFRRKPVEDTPSSSANARMIRNLLILTTLTGETVYQDAAELSLKSFQSEMAGHGMYVSALGLALFETLSPPLKLEVMGSDSALMHAARKAFSPGKIICYTPQAEASSIQVCEGSRCVEPVTSADMLVERLGVLHHSRVRSVD